jgi:thioredoxin reductase (NADPH)
VNRSEGPPLLQKVKYDGYQGLPTKRRSRKEDGVNVNEKRVENVIIVGGACAGYTAATYTARAELEPLVIEGFQWGGQLQNTTDVENYPGFPEGIMGPELMQKFRDQAERFGARFISDDATRIELSDGGIHSVWVGDEEYRARSVILAMGAEPKRLGIPGELELGGRGVSTCGVCDGAFFKGENVAVIGGGDSAMEDSIFISKFANDLSVVHRRDAFRASKIMEERARGRENITFKTPYVPEEFIAGDDGKLAKVRLRQADTGETEELEVGGAFVAIGHTPRSELVAGQVETDDGGYVITEGKSTRTNLAGVFAVGDLVDHTYRQAVTAAGTGTMGALDAEWYLRDVPPSPEAHWAGKAGEAQPEAADAEERAEVSAS